MTEALLFAAAAGCSVLLVWLLDRMVARDMAVASQEQEAWDRHVTEALTQASRDSRRRLDDLLTCEAIWEASR